MPLKFISICVLLLVLASGCKSQKKTVSYNKRAKRELPKISEEKTEATKVTPPAKPEPTPAMVTKPTSYEAVVSNYIAEFKEIAQQEMLQYGIPASITIAQGILESGAGRGELSNRANNHFGIKCHKGWEGERVYHDDDEAQECFRKYKDPKYSYRDHSLFLTTRSRYGDLFKLDKDDYKGWARGLKKAGYATDPKYPDKLISIIERYGLQQFDAQVLGETPLKPLPSKNQITTYTVKKGDTLYSIAKKHGITVDNLKEYNGMRDNTLSIGQVLYLHAPQN